MSYCREALSKQQVKRAADLAGLPDGQYTRVAGCVIARQRPGTAKGFVFLSLEDETGISNIIVNPGLYEKYRKGDQPREVPASRGRSAESGKRNFDQSEPCDAHFNQRCGNRVARFSLRFVSVTRSPQSRARASRRFHSHRARGEQRDSGCAHRLRRQGLFRRPK